MAYLDTSPGARTETITFCPSALKGFSGESLKSVREKTYSKGERNLDDIHEKALGVNLLHKLSHSSLVLGRSDVYGVLFYSYVG